MSEPQRRVRILWTETAKEGLRSLPKKVRKGLLDKADELYECTDPKYAHKPLAGPLAGYYRITYSRYRAVYRVDEEEIANGDTLITVTVTFIAAGTRREYSRDDVYRVAEKAVELGLVDAEPDDEAEPKSEV